MPIKKRCAVVFVHGLAKKPAPDKLEEIWRWGLMQDDSKKFLRGLILEASLKHAHGRT